MKKIILITITILFAIATNAQIKDFEKLAVKKTWKLDVEAMKPLLLLRLSFVPQMKDLSEKDKNITIEAILKTLENMLYEFDENGIFKVSFVGLEKNNYSGTYMLDSNLNELALTSVAQTQKYIIKSITNEEMQLTSISNKLDFILINKKP